MSLRHLILTAAFSVMASNVWAQSTPSAVTRAIKAVEAKPTARRLVGLAEIQRAHGLHAAALESLKKAAAEAKSAEIQELLCWRLLPTSGTQRESFRQAVATLKALDAGNAWGNAWELFLALNDSDRPALLEMMAKAPLASPTQFPITVGEACHLELLKELGHSPSHAAAEVVSARGFEPLHALRDFDRALTREADFLRSIDRPADAKRVFAVRDHFRNAYIKASRHLVERLFALHLAGQDQERDRLLAKAAAIPYLHDRNQLAVLFERMDEAQGWSSLLEPLLTSEIALIENPPNLATLPTNKVARLDVKSRQKTVQGNTIQYEGDVRCRLNTTDIRCDKLTVVQGDTPASVILAGSGHVKLGGSLEYPRGVTADRFAFHAETGSFSVGGDVRLHGHDKVTKLRACTLTKRGEVRDARSLLDDFNNSFTIAAKLDLLPKITQIYEDDELPDEVRYLLALNLLRPHMTWHAPYLPPQPQDGRLDRVEVERVKDTARHSEQPWPWQEAMTGETWMLDDIAPEVQLAYRDALRAWYKQYADDSKRRDSRPAAPDFPIPDKDLCFWRLRDRNHTDVIRAEQLLQGIQGNDLRSKARRWAEEIRRNNTVLTFDIPGAASKDHPHSMLLDVRNAEKVSFKVYRVQDAEELVFATQFIGADFIYREHLLNRQPHDRQIVDLIKTTKVLRERIEQGRSASSKPIWRKGPLVHSWDIQVADLPHHPPYRERSSWRRWYWHDWYGEPDARYFDDECSAHRSRIDKDYRPQYENQISSWRCDRVVSIPQKTLTQAGAYILVAEANGQSAHVPIVVDPISLMLRRCRDGVFVLASDAEGKEPLAGAKVHARRQLDANLEKTAAVTDREGAAFARVLAVGDRALIVEHQGRYAIGGFGQVFEGIYHAPFDDHHRYADRPMRAARERLETKDSSYIYRDRHVVAAYTDRPTYRPGQEANFKLIVRKLLAENRDNLSAVFRAADFDAKTRMTLPELDMPLDYTVVDPKGRDIAHGSLKLSEFGTAADKVALNEESVLGAYSLRVRIAGQDRIVPDLFAVKHYRRPNFDVKLTGVPELLTKPETLHLTVSGQYYFGPPITKGTVEVHVYRHNQRQTVLHERAALTEKGSAHFELRLPRALEPGRFLVVSTITDESGRTVSESKPLRISSPDAPKETAGLEKLPRFLAVDQELVVATSAKTVVARQDWTTLKFSANKGTATLKFSKPGWYRVEAADEEAFIFAYGGDRHPLDFPAVPPDDEDEARHRLLPKWVNLSDFALEEDDHLSRWERPSQHLYALFDQQSLKVGDKLRTLVYVPMQKAKLLFTLEGRTVLDYAVHWTAEKGGAYQVVEISMKERYFPNCYVQGRILTPEKAPPPPGMAKERAKRADRFHEEEDVNPRWCRVDVAKPVGKLEAGLNVEVTTNKPSYQPGDIVRAKVKVTDRDGRPQAAEVSLAAVDESVFVFGEDQLDALTGFFHTPHNERRFLPKVWRTSIGETWSAQALAKLDQQERRLNDLVRNLEAMQGAAKAAIEHQQDAMERHHLTMAPAKSLPRLGGEMPIGELPLARLREHFHETAAWMPQLRTNEAGLAEASFTLPDSLTRYRLSSVALTKTSDVGVGRARITAGLPLAVQVFLPRFAVEKDRLLAVALIHNSSDLERTCSFSWEIENALAEAPNPRPEAWRLVQDKGKFVATGQIKVPAKSHTKVGIWLRLDSLGLVRIAFRAGDDKEADAEVRTMPVQPLGRPADFNAIAEAAAIPQPKLAEKQIVGKFNKSGRIALPAGFLARELSVSIAGSELAHALAGLDYLVDYPHGCIEQTMSRFLPVVMIKHATLHSPVALQPDVAKKLPDILEKGLTRVYSFQHADGSWGWFEKDSRNLAMSVYVVYGLARCRAAGVKVDPQVLRNGCDYLLRELRGNPSDLDLAARAWFAVALADQADAKELEAYARLMIERRPPPQTCCNLALACRTAGLRELGEQFWKKARDWQPHTSETSALYLNTQLAFGASYADCRRTASQLLQQRTGSYWAHTRDTSWAIEALSNMLAYVPEKSTVRQMEVKLAGKTILHVRDAAELKKMLWRVHLTAEDLPQKEALELQFQSDSDEPIHVAVRARGVQRQDAVAATGQRVQLHRRIESLDGTPIEGPLKIGQVVRVRLQLQLENAERYLLVEERRPALCEFAADHIVGSAANSAVHHDFHDDRLCIFFSLLSPGTHEIVYYLRAETAGMCSVLPGAAYPMYDAKARGETAGNKLEVGTP